MFQKLKRAGSAALALFVAAGLMPAGTMITNAAEVTDATETVLSITEANCLHTDATVLKAYTKTELEELAKENTDLVSYIYLKGGVNVCAVPEYVTFDQIFEDAEITWQDYRDAGSTLILKAYGEKPLEYPQDYAALDNNTKNDYKFYPNMTDADQANVENGVFVPACISLKWANGKVEGEKTAGDLANELAEKATEGLRSFSGTLASDLTGDTDKGTTAGKRMVTDIREVAFVNDPELVYHSAKAATATEPGNKEYYECSVCHQKFTDAAGTELATDADIIIPKVTQQPTPVQASQTTVTLSETSYAYNGTVRKPSVTVKDKNGKTIASSNYDVTYTGGCKNAGTYKVTVTFNGKAYTGSKTANFEIVRAAQTIKLPKKDKETYSYKVSALKKAKKAFSLKPTIKRSGKAVKNVKVTYKTTSAPKGAKKYISVTSKGKVTLKKGAKKGIYKIKVSVAKTKTNYKAASRTVTVKVK